MFSTSPTTQTFTCVHPIRNMIATEFCVPKIEILFRHICRCSVRDAFGKHTEEYLHQTATSEPFPCQSKNTAKTRYLIFVFALSNRDSYLMINQNNIISFNLNQIYKTTVI